MIKRFFPIVVLFVLPFSAALAANEVQTSNGITLILPTDSSNYTLKNGSKFDSLNISATQFTVTLSQGGNVTITSGDRKQFSHNAANPIIAQTTCAATESSITLTIDPPFTTTAVTITPSGTCNTGGGGSSVGSGGGGGGGGGGYSPLPSPAPAPAPAPAPLPAPAPAPSRPSVFFANDLFLGSQGQEVIQLQALLAADPVLFPEGKITGYFGPATQRAVKRFQQKYGLPQIGRVGPKTRVKLNELYSAQTVMPPPAPAPSAQTAGGYQFATNLSRGNTGADVRALQEFLALDSAVYPEGTISGFFGPATELAVKRFQEKYGIAKAGDTGYGRVGPKTRAKFNELGGSMAPTPPPAPAPVPQSTASQAEALQKQLQMLQDQLKALQGSN